MSESTDALLARGRPITLADGTKRRLRFSIPMLMEFEQHYGTIPDMAIQMGRERKFIRDIVYVFSLAFGAEDDAGVLVPLSQRETVRLMAPGRIQEYLGAIYEALRESMGAEEAPKAEAPSSGEVVLFPGTGSGASPSGSATSPPASTDA
jgi:hypothetical protein